MLRASGLHPPRGLFTGTFVVLIFFAMLSFHDLNISCSSVTLHSTMGDNDEELKKQPPGNRDCHPGAEWVSIS